MPARSSRTTPKPPVRKYPIDPTAGQRLKTLRLRAGLTQRQLAGDRYTAAYVSALEKGLTRASMAALGYLAERLGVSMDYFLRDESPRWDLMNADLRLASGDWQGAVDAYTDLLDRKLGDPEKARILRGRAEALLRLDRPQEALPDAAAAYELLGRAGERTDLAYATSWLAYAHYKLDNTAEARALIHQALAEVRAGLSVQADFRLRLLVALANIETWDGNHDRALAYLVEGRSLADEMDDLRRATYLRTLAVGHAQTGDHEAALRFGTQALALYEAVDAEAEIASLHNSLAMTYLEVGNLRRAGAMATDAHHRAERLDDRRLLAHVLDTEARIALASGKTDVALERATATLELARELGHPHAEASAHLTLARAHRAGGNLAEAEAACSASASVLRKVGPRSRLREVLREWADILSSQDRHKEAVALLDEALAEHRA
jgi:transcriptional regulator with XRE-family HTH domain